MFIFRQPERGSQNRRANAAPADHFGGKTPRLGGEQSVLQGCTNADPLLMRRDVWMVILNSGDNGQKHRAGQRPRACRRDHRSRHIGFGSTRGLYEEVSQSIAFVIWVKRSGPRRP